jgi:hypothetical protein
LVADDSGFADLGVPAPTFRFDHYPANPAAEKRVPHLNWQYPSQTANPDPELSDMMLFWHLYLKIVSIGVALLFLRLGCHLCCLVGSSVTKLSFS